MLIDQVLLWWKPIIDPSFPCFNQCWLVIDFFSISGGPVIIIKKIDFQTGYQFYFFKSDFWDLRGINIRQGSVNQVINIIWFLKGKNRLVCIRAGYCNNLFENQPMQCLGRLLSWKIYTFYLQSDIGCLHKKRNAKSTSKLAYWIRATNNKTQYSSPLLLHGSNALLKTQNSQLFHNCNSLIYHLLQKFRLTSWIKLSLFTPNSKLSFI
jgi:hypothetical protein